MQVLGPLSTLTNWVSEFERWAPDFPVSQACVLWALATLGPRHFAVPAVSLHAFSSLQPCPLPQLRHACLWPLPVRVALYLAAHFQLHMPTLNLLATHLQVVLYHGSKQERQAIRSKRMPTGALRAGGVGAQQAELAGPLGAADPCQPHGWPHTMQRSVMARPLLSHAAWMPASRLAWPPAKSCRPPLTVRTPLLFVWFHSGRVDAAFPVVVTSYEILLSDIKFMAKYHWKYIVVDEVRNWVGFVGGGGWFCRWWTR